MPLKEALIEKRGRKYINMGNFDFDWMYLYWFQFIEDTDFFGTEEVIYKKYNHDAISKKKIGT